MGTSLQRVIRCVEEVFRNKGLEPPAVAPTTEFTPDFGLDSLDYAELVVRLEQEFGFDPFASGAVREVRTASDLAAVYERDVPAS